MNRMSSPWPLQSWWALALLTQNISKQTHFARTVPAWGRSAKRVSGRGTPWQLSRIKYQQKRSQWTVETCESLAPNVTYSSPFPQALVVECHGMLWMGVTKKYEILLCRSPAPHAKGEWWPKNVQEPSKSQSIKVLSPRKIYMKVGHQRHHVTTPCLFAAYSQQFHPPLGVVIVLAEDLL